MSIVEKEYNLIVQKYNPHSVYTLIQDSDCEILYSDLDDETGGCTVSTNRCHTIIVNNNWDEQYQKFVILHEFSHIRLHKGTNTPFYRKLSLDSFVHKIEKEANELALKLLICMQDSDEVENLTKYQLMDLLGLPHELEKFI